MSKQKRYICGCHPFASDDNCCDLKHHGLFLSDFKLSEGTLKNAEQDDDTLEAQWCIDSETGERKLLDLKTGKDITPIP